MRCLGDVHDHVRTEGDELVPSRLEAVISLDSVLGLLEEQLDVVNVEILVDLAIGERKLDLRLELGEVGNAGEWNVVGDHTAILLNGSELCQSARLQCRSGARTGCRRYWRGLRLRGGARGRCCELDALRAQCLLDVTFIGARGDVHAIGLSKCFEFRNSRHREVCGVWRSPTFPPKEFRELKRICRFCQLSDSMDFTLCSQMNCRRIPRYVADDLAEQAGLDPDDPRYRNAEVLCRRAQGLEPPYEWNLDLAWQFEQLQRVRRDLFDKGLVPTPSQFQANANSHAAKVIAEYPQLITSSAQLRGVDGMGNEIRAHVDEWLQTGQIKLLAELEEQLHQATGEYTQDYHPPDVAPVRVLE